MQGVTIPSQQRYVHYYERYLLLANNNELRNYDHTLLNLYRVRFYTVPDFDVGGGCDPYFKIFRIDGKLFFDYRKGPLPVQNLHRNHAEIVDIECDTVIYGDVKFVFMDQDMFSKDDKMFWFWINTSFIEGSKLVLHKHELDGAGVLFSSMFIYFLAKDTKNENFRPEFKIELFFRQVDSSRAAQVLDDSDSGEDLDDLNKHDDDENS